jgi:hypothetical protein
MNQLSDPKAKSELVTISQVLEQVNHGEEPGLDHCNVLQVTGRGVRLRDGYNRPSIWKPQN